MSHSGTPSRRSPHSGLQRDVFVGLLVAIGIMGGIGVIGNSMQGQMSDGGIEENSTPVLSACSGSSLLFPRLRVNSLKTWGEDYHETVSSVVMAVEEAVQSPTCTVSQSEQIPKPLSDLAKKLPPWADEERLQTLRTEDVGSVLLEHLRLYECALQERAWELPVQAGNEVMQRNKDLNLPSNFVALPDATNEQIDQLKTIQREMALARPALHRTLLFLAGTLRLSPVSGNMECLARASADMRNIFGLTAEASACLPKIWDAQGALRNSTNTRTSEE